MGIEYIDGFRLRNAVVAGAQRVIQMQERLNNINVFPVPDGDTGTNMALTLKSIAQGAVSIHNRRLDVVSSTLAESALMGARGNSGAILAQFFQGLADGFRDHDRVGNQQFAFAVSQAAIYARDAISQPKEGTILTVIQDWAAHIQDKWHTNRDFVALLSNALQTAYISLQETPKKLKVLAKAGVVDAGAQGFVNMLEGVSHYIETGKIGNLFDFATGSRTEKARVDSETREDLTYQFCTECFIRGTNLNPKLIREAVQSLGDSLIVAGSSQYIRIHIHTNEPDKLFTIVGNYGTIVSTKKDDMWDQFSREHVQKTDDIAIITDSTCGLTPDYIIKHKIRIVPLNIIIDGETYQDGVNITNEEFYYQLHVKPDMTPKTSQPAPAVFQEVYQLAAENHKQALAIFMSSGYSGTFQNGLNVAKKMKDIHIEMIDSKTLSAGLGFLVQIAVEAKEEGCSIEEIIRRVEIAKKYVYCYVSIRDVELLIRGGRVSRFKGMMANLMNMKPVVGFLPDGNVHVVAKTRGGKPNQNKVLELVKEKTQNMKNLRFCIVHADEPEGAAYFVEEVKKTYGVGEIPVLSIAAVAGAHSGRGAVGVGFIGFPEGVEAF